MIYPRPNPILFCLAILFLVYTARAQERETIALRNGWKFFRGRADGASRKDFDDTGWESVSVPHDWGVDRPFMANGNPSTAKLDWRGEGWYRRHINLTSEYKNKRLYLLFDGVMASPIVYINGKHAGGWDYGYNSFFLDITDLVTLDGANTIAVHVDTRDHDSRWYPGAGIYRKVQMIVVSPVHVAIWGTYVTTPVIKPGYADIRIAATINNTSAKDQNVTVKQTIFSKEDIALKVRKDSILISAHKSGRMESTLTLSSPVRWDLVNPYLYTVKTELYQANKLVDTYVTPFGIRDLRFTANNGLYLNDRRVQIKGVNLHHDQGPLGAAFNVRAMERQLEIMKEMGCNAIRTSHNMPAPELLDLCDRMGFLVLDEAFDKYDAKVDISDTTNFEDFSNRNIRNFITRDRNHPCVFLWSVGNEMADVETNRNNGFYKLQTMVNNVKKYDGTRPVTMASDMLESANFRHFDYYDVHSWNYGRRYLLARQLEPNKPVLITESASTVSTRGFYEFPLPKTKTNFTGSLQVSSYDLNCPPWAEVPDDDFMWQEEDPFVMGEFVWTGFDYLGEPIPYGSVREYGKPDSQTSRSSYFGIVDLCGIPKDRYYLYKSYWNLEQMTIHILPHWNWPERIGKNVPVFVYTNGDSAELFLNGRSLGVRQKDPKSQKGIDRFRLMWDSVIYQPGELKVIAYKEGKKLGESTVKTTGRPYKIKLTPDRKQIKADGSDLSYILIEAIDDKGDTCPLADDKIQIKISGPGKLAGIDNGNPQSLNFFKSNTVNLFYGKAMLIVQSENVTGNLIVDASSKGLIKATTIVSAK